MPGKSTRTIITPGKVYHIYNRGNNHSMLFLQANDYQIFLDRFMRFIHPHAEVYAFCLLGTHYHLLLRVKDEAKAVEFTNGMGSLLKSYTNKINLKYSRRGGLYQGRYKRLEVRSQVYFRKLVTYIHLNPIKHGLHTNYADYPYSSYRLYHSKDDSILVREPVIMAFDSLENFKFVHEAGAVQWRGAAPLGELLPI